MPGGRCDQCGVEEYMPYVCKFCKGRFCAAHRLPENHACSGLEAYRDRMRQEGRVFAPEITTPMQPRVSPGAKAGASLDAVWSKLDGKMTYVIIGICVAVYVLEFIIALGNPAAFDDLFVIQSDFLLQPWTIVTSMFSHDIGGFNHIFFNMLVLLFFGTTTERLIGTKRFTGLFLAAGAISGIAEVLIMQLVYHQDVSALGASGAIQGVMGTLVVLAPTLTVLVFFIIPAPLWALTIFYVLFDIIGFISPGSSNVANAAHLTGLAVGLAYGYYLREKKGLRAVVQPPPSIRRYF